MELPAVFLWALFAVLGLCFGSFFNVLIYRMPHGMSILRPASHCPNCKHKILFWQNIPILSWLFLGGKCYYCKKNIPIKYPFVEFLGLLFGFLAAFLTEPNYAKNADLVKCLTLFWLIITLIPIFAIDFKYLLLPDTITIGGIFVGFILSCFNKDFNYISSLIGIAVCGGGLFLFSVITSKIIKKEGMGFGDVKLFASFGAIMGVELTFLSLMIAAVIALAVIVPFRFLAKINMDKPLPFGPFLGVAAPISYLFGSSIIEAILKI